MTQPVTLGELKGAGDLDFGDGYRTRADQLASEGFRILRAADVLDGAVSLTGPDFVGVEHASAIGSKRAQAGDVVLTSKGTVGRVARMPALNEPVVYSPQLCYFRPRVGGRLEAAYLQHWLHSAEFAAQAGFLMHNTDMAPYISLRDLSSMRISLPPLPTQQAIAEVLGALDDKILANIGTKRTIDALLNVLWRDALSEPGGRTAPFLETVTVEFGEPYGGDQFVPPGRGRPLIRIRDIEDGDCQVWTTERRERDISVLAGDVLVGMDAEFRPHVWSAAPGLLNQRVMRVTCRQLGSALMREAIRDPLKKIERSKSATTVIHLNKRDLQEATIALPSQEAIAALQASAGSLFDTALTLSLESRTLAALRDTLLPELMSGRLHVKDAERAAEEAL